MVNIVLIPTNLFTRISRIISEISADKISGA